MNDKHNNQVLIVLISVHIPQDMYFPEISVTNNSTTYTEEIMHRCMQARVCTHA